MKKIFLLLGLIFMLSISIASATFISPESVICEDTTDCANTNDGNFNTYALIPDAWLGKVWANFTLLPVITSANLSFRYEDDGVEISFYCLNNLSSYSLLWNNDGTPFSVANVTTTIPSNCILANNKVNIYVDKYNDISNAYIYELWIDYEYEEPEITSYEDNYVNITFSTPVTTNVTNLSTVIITAPNYVSIDTNAYPEFNVSATITLKNLSYSSICPISTAFNVNNMRHYYPMNESSGAIINDYGTYSQNGDLYNTTWVTGLNGKPAIRFDNSVVSFVDIAGDSAYSSDAGDISTCFLIKAPPYNPSKAMGTIWNNLQPMGGSSAFGLALHERGLHAQNYNGGYYASYNLTIGIDDNQWHHVCYQVNSYNRRFYVDGVKINNAYDSGAGFASANSNGISFGANQVSPHTGGLNASISDFRFYRATTTDSNVIDIYRTQTCNPSAQMIIKKNGAICSGTQCASVDLYNGNAVFNVTGFSNYSITNTTNMNFIYNTPANGSVITVNLVTFDWNITSDAGLNFTTLSVSNSSGVYYTNNYSGNSNLTSHFSQQLTLPFANYTWFISAKDIAGNTFVGGTESFQVIITTYTISSDYTYPILSPAGQVAEDTTESIATTTNWFPIIITIVVMVALILLVALIIMAMKGIGFVGGTA